MSTFLRDESEVQSILNKGLSPEPIIITKGAGYSLVNYTFIDGQYKNVFVEANGDYIDFDNVYTLKDGEFIECVVTPNSYSGGLVYLFGSQVNNTTYGLISLASIQLRGASTGTLTFADTFTLGVTYKLRFERTVNDIELFVNGVSSSTQTVTVASDYNIDRLARRGTVNSGNVTHQYIDLNGVKFNLDEPSGILTTATNGNTGTRFTSHINGLDYINDVMIQPIQI